MKLTLATAALVGFFTTSTIAGRDWVYNDHRRALGRTGHQERTAIAKYSDLCARWDGARCLDDEDKPSPWEMAYLQRKTAKIEKEDAEHAVEMVRLLWEKWNVEEAERMGKVKKESKEGKEGKTLEEVPEKVDANA